MEPKFTAAEKRDEAKREVAMRRRVYGLRGMNKAHQRQIAIMYEIAEDYAAAAEAEQLPLAP